MKKQQPVRFLDLAKQHRRFKAEMLKAVGRILEHSQFILGPETQLLEKELAMLCRTSFALGVNSGTDALILALRALDIGPGDEVLVPDFTFVATASSVMLCGATPVLVDIEPDTFNIDCEQARRKITKRTRAIIPVHLYGQAADMTKLLRLARAHKLAVIEDAAQALGGTWQGKPVGGLGSIGCLSFFPTKNLGALGDAGMVVTASKSLAARLNRLRQHGAERKYYHDELGLNSRMDEIQSAALRIKLPYLAQWNARRRQIAAAYQAGLAELPMTLPYCRKEAVHVYHQFAIRTQQRNALQEHLTACGIGSAVHYPLALHEQPMLKHLPSVRQSYPVSQAAASTVLCLPVAPELTDVEVRRIILAVQSFWKKGNSRHGY